MFIFSIDLTKSFTITQMIDILIHMDVLLHPCDFVDKLLKKKTFSFSGVHFITVYLHIHHHTVSWPPSLKLKDLAFNFYFIFQHNMDL